VLLASVGIGAVGGALVLPGVRKRLGADRTVQLGTLGMAVALALTSLAPSAATGLMAWLLAGAAWIAVLSSLNVAAQSVLPDWVRARGLAIFLTVFSGAMAAGSLGWGAVASDLSIGAVQLAAAIGLVLAVPLTAFARLAGLGTDQSPANHWPEAGVQMTADEDGPATIWIAYAVPAACRSADRKLARGLVAVASAPPCPCFPNRSNHAGEDPRAPLGPARNPSPDHS